MWHEAKNHERAQRAWMVDRRKRAERRREFYESINVNPLNYLKVLGRKCTVSVAQQQMEPTEEKNADRQQSLLHATNEPSRSSTSAAVLYGSASFMNKSWNQQNGSKNDVDRFDVRSHLESFQLKRLADAAAAAQPSGIVESAKLSASVVARLNYERYRNLIKSKLAQVSEENIIACVRRANDEDSPMNKRLDSQKRNKQAKKRPEKATFGFDYAAVDSNSTTILTSIAETTDDLPPPPSSPSLTIEQLETAITFAELSQWFKSDAAMAAIAEQHGGIALKTFKYIMLEDVEREEQIRQAAFSNAAASENCEEADDENSLISRIHYCDAAVRADLQQISPEDDAEAIATAENHRKSDENSATSRKLSSRRDSRSSSSGKSREKTKKSDNFRRRRRRSSSSDEDGKRRRKRRKASNSPEYSASESDSHDDSRRRRRKRSSPENDREEQHRQVRDQASPSSWHRRRDADRRSRRHERSRSRSKTQRDRLEKSGGSSNAVDFRSKTLVKPATAAAAATQLPGGDFNRKLKPAEIIKLRMQQALQQTQMRDQKAERAKLAAAAAHDDGGRSPS